MPRGFYTNVKNENKKMKELTEFYISQKPQTVYSDNEEFTLEDKIKKCGVVSQFHDYLISSGKTVYKDTKVLPALDNTATYNKSRLRLLKKLQERRDKKK